MQMVGLDTGPAVAVPATCGSVPPPYTAPTAERLSKHPVMQLRAAERDRRAMG
eukprot:gene15830-21835_t